MAKTTVCYILPPFLTRENVGVYNGSAGRAALQHATICAAARQEYVLLSNSQ